MKKFLIALPVLFLSLALSAQQTEDEIYIGKGKTFGNYKGPDAKPIDGQKTIGGTVIGGCKKDCCNKLRTFCSITLQIEREDSLVSVGTRDFGFTVPKEIKGHTIIVEGIVAGQTYPVRDRREVQRGIQFAATGILVID